MFDYYTFIIVHGLLQINDGNHDNNDGIDNEEIVLNTNQVLCSTANRYGNNDGSSSNNDTVISDTEVSADEMSIEIVPTQDGIQNEDHHYSRDGVDHSTAGKLEKEIIMGQDDIQNEDHRAGKESGTIATSILNIVDKCDKDHTHDSSSSSSNSVSDTGNHDHTHESSSSSSSSVFSLIDRVEIVNPKKTNLSFSSENDTDVQSEDSFGNVDLLGMLIMLIIIIIVY